MQIKDISNNTIKTILFGLPTAVGAIAILWVATLFIGTDALALAITMLIGIAFAIGIAELVQFRRATESLESALGQIPEGLSDLEEWLHNVHSSLQNSVRLRIESDRVGLPAPVITPYLVGLLVMLGLLGTFVGMVDTLGGAVTALEGSTELQAIREGLAAPINGLALAFGTSVAGVAASAMLGLVSTLSRRERMQATRLLDHRIATDLRSFSLTHNRQQTYNTMQAQADALPEMVDRLARLSETLVNNQMHFHDSIHSAFTGLAESVENTLSKSLNESSTLAGDSISALITDNMEALSREAKSTHQHMSDTADQQFKLLASQFAQTTAEVTDAWKEGLGAQDEANQRLLATVSETSSNWATQAQQGDAARLQHWEAAFETMQANIAEHLHASSTALSQELKLVAVGQQQALNGASDTIQEFSESVTEQWTHSGERMEALTETMAKHVAALGKELEQPMARLMESAAETPREAAKVIKQLRTDAANTIEQMSVAAIAQWSQSGEKMEALSETVASHVAALGKELEQPMTRLIETASETPKAAAEVISQLREEISNNIERDNDLLQERKTLMEQLGRLSDSLESNSAQQRDAVESLIQSSSSTLVEVSAHFGDHVEGQLEKITSATDHFASSATEMAELGDTFSSAVLMYNESNNELVEQLTRMEQAMGASTNRSDEQMAYYVAQAREIIDQSLLSQKEMFEQLRALNKESNKKKEQQPTEELHAVEAS